MAEAAAPAALDWAEKHRPRRLADIVGNSKALEELKAWADAWDDGMPAARAVILAGDPGVGKTTAALALAREKGWGLVEMNASDERNEDAIRRVATSGAVNRSLDSMFSDSAPGSGRQLIVLDEADNLFGREDRGGMAAILDTIRVAKQPIILIANDYYELTRRGASLKSLALTIKFTKVHSRSIPPALKRIAQAEGLALGPGVAEAIAERAGGDMRSAVNDLQALAAGRARVTSEDVEALGKRDETGDIWGLLGKVFYGRDLKGARESAFNLDETPEAIALWIDENLPVMYTHRADLVDGYAALSRADVYLGRVSRRQQYSLWGYASTLMTAGVALAKHDRPAGARFQFPSWLRKQSQSRAVRDLRKRVAHKMALELLTSLRAAREDLFPLVRQLYAADPDFAKWVAWKFELDADELAFLLDLKAASAEVKKAIEAAKTMGPRPVLASAAAGGLGGFDEGEDDEAPPAPARKKLAARKSADEDEDEDEEGDEDDDEEESPAAATKAAAPSKGAQAKLAPAPESEASAPAAEEPSAKKKQKNLFEF